MPAGPGAAFCRLGPSSVARHGARVFFSLLLAPVKPSVLTGVLRGAGLPAVSRGAGEGGCRSEPLALAGLHRPDPGPWLLPAPSQPGAPPALAMLAKGVLGSHHAKKWGFSAAETLGYVPERLGPLLSGGRPPLGVSYPPIEQPPRTKIPGMHRNY